MSKNKFASEIEGWLFFVREDIKAAKVSLRSRLFSTTCFHAQQAAEKAIKAYLLSKTGKTPKIHHLNGLIRIKPTIRKEFLGLLEEIEFLDQFYVPTRYPDAFPGSLPEGLPNKNDAQKALEFAQEIVRFVEKKLKI